MKRQHGSKHEAVRKLTKTGEYTYYVTIPKAIIDELKWRERQRLEVALEDGHVVVRDYRPSKRRG